jgi:isocitrate dehydrogenase
MWCGAPGIEGRSLCFGCQIDLSEKLIHIVPFILFSEGPASGKVGHSFAKERRMASKITVAFGDGIGPEIMEASLKVLEAGGGDFSMDEIEIGEKVYKAGFTSGIRPEDWDKITTNQVFLKAPITTPQGGGYKSLNVTIRKTLGLFANVRPVQSLHPFVKTKHPKMDLVIVRENEEDLYAGIEHRQTPEVYQCLKLITRPGCERIVRYAFEYAMANGRKKITCMSKDNIMKLTDGLFHKVFDEIAPEYPDIETEHWIIDIGAARLANTPEDFDVIVTANLYGDILSDIVAEISGSVGLAGSCNIGKHCSMFEAIHGSAPMIAGQGIANPSGLLLGGTQMLRHMGQGEAAARIENAWLKTIEDGVATLDIFDDSLSKSKVNTKEFAQAIIDRLGEQPKTLVPRSFNNKKVDVKNIDRPQKPPKDKQLHGMDVFIYEEERNPNWLGEKLEKAAQSSPLNLKMITNRGVKVYPDGHPQTFCTDHWRCRFEAEGSVDHKALWSLLNQVTDASLEVIKNELLYSFDGERGYSLGQGQ